MAEVERATATDDDTVTGEPDAQSSAFSAAGCSCS
jgi:hypothetical protein